MTVPESVSRREIVYSALFAVIIVIAAGGMALYVLSDHSLILPLYFERVAEEIGSYYDEPVNWTKLFASSTKSMFDGLDRFSYFIEPRQYDRLDEEMTGEYVGIGITVVGHELGLLVMNVRQEGPAAAAGVQTGDVIIQSDNTRLGSLDPDHGSMYLRGREGSSVRLRIYRPTLFDTLSLDVVRRKIRFQHVPFAGYRPDSIMYIRLTDFDAGATEQLKQALDSLMTIEGKSPRGLILDLRGNPGGLFSEAFETANLFLKRGTFIVGTAGRSYWNDEEHKADGEDITHGLTMVILVDDGTASAAEIVSGALQRNGRAILAGDTTFGKGLVQGFTRFDDGSGTRLTISRYFLPGNLYLNQFDSTLHDTGRGLVPDVAIDYEDQKPFVRALEGSMMLQEFATANQDAIVEGNGDFAPGGNWLGLFVEHAAVQKFAYRTPELKAAEQLLALAEKQQESPQVLAGTRQLVNVARHDMAQVFVDSRPYIRTRLRELAFERKFGLNRAYAEVTVRERDDINRAAAILKEHR